MFQFKLILKEIVNNLYKRNGCYALGYNQIKLLNVKKCMYKMYVNKNKLKGYSSYP